MAIELMVNLLDIYDFNSDNLWLKILGSAIDGGILVVVALPLLSELFSKWIRVSNLDLCRGYSINFVKIYYSIVVIANCIWFLALAGTGIVNDNSEVQIIFNRAILWILNVVGTWAGIGFHCEGRITEELDNIKRSKEKKNIKEILEYSFPFAIAFIVNCLLLFVQTFNIRWIQEKFSEIEYIVIISMVGVLISVWILSPSEKRSNRKLAEAISQINDKKIVKGRYKTIQYSLVNQESQKYLLIHERTVIWQGHKEEIRRCFGERKESVEKFDYEECKLYLVELEKKRNECLCNGYKTFEEEVKKQLLEEKKR